MMSTLCLYNLKGMKAHMSKDEASNISMRWPAAELEKKLGWTTKINR